MGPYYIKKMHIVGLWGYREINIDFFDDINIIIGPNASGKTTLLNLIRYIFTADLINLANIEFNEVQINLSGFTDKTTRTIKVRKIDGTFTFRISQKKYQISVPLLSDEPGTRSHRYNIRRLRRSKDYIELEESLLNLVSAVWLPVNRRLPIQVDEERDYILRTRISQVDLESVDVRLSQLSEELIHYRLRLEAKISENYKEFEKRVLRMILYSKQHDQLEGLSLEPATQEDKEQLIRAFDTVGLLDSQMENRIEEHFSAAQSVIDSMERAVSEDKKDFKLDMETVLIIPLISRTKLIVENARELEEERRKLFLPLSDYENIANSFLDGKEVRIDENGKLMILSSDTQHELEVEQLSSGEKQILILLTQALLWEDRPVIYVVDEPELSLHVSWQENLLKSLMILGRNIQIIVATHSPDIIGTFTENVINLGKLPQ